MIEIAENTYDFYTGKSRPYPLFDILVDKTRVATRRTRNIAYKHRADIELHLGYKCNRGTQMKSFQHYYRTKYGNNDINC